MRRGRDRTALIGTLVVAIIALGGVIGGAYLGAQATITSAREQLQEGQRQTARSTRAKVYADFLAATNRFAVASFDGLASCKAHRARSRRCSVSAGVAASVGRARYSFQDAINQVYVYGSRQAVRASVGVARTLPPSEVGLRETFTLEPINEQAVDDAYIAFLNTMCREVSPDPRPTC